MPFYDDGSSYDDDSVFYDDDGGVEAGLNPLPQNLPSFNARSRAVTVFISALVMRNASNFAREGMSG